MRTFARTTALVVAGTAMGMSWLPVQHAWALGAAVLIATPGEGHAGDVVYLSGSGLRPRTRLLITMACPDWHSPSTGANHNLVYGSAGPSTDRNGSFAGFPFHVLALHGVPSSSCQIYAGDGANPFGPTFPASYAIIAAGEPLPACARQICLTVEDRHVAGRDLLVIHGWPGARGTLTVSGRQRYRRTYHLRLDWQGLDLVSVGHQKSLPPAAIHISATVRLGAAVGSYSGSLRSVPAA